MQDAPSRTALRVALRRAAHQLYDAPPLVFSDPIAVPILGPHAAELTRTPGLSLGRRPSLKPRSHSFALRAFLVGRSRYAEDLLAQAVAGGTTQYILLGAGLDTFAHRNPHTTLQVFEMDHPATQAWKRDLLAQANLPHPPGLTYLPIDFETDTLAQTLLPGTSNPAPPVPAQPSVIPTGGEAGAEKPASGRDHGQFLHTAVNPNHTRPDPTRPDPTRPAFFAALGVVPYLTLEAFRATLRTVAAFARGSTLVFDYALPRHLLPRAEQLAVDSISARVRAAGEPFHLFFTPDQVAAELRDHHLTPLEDLDGEAINARYFNHRRDDLRAPAAAHLIAART